MKINIIGTVLAAALIALFSTAGFTMKSTQVSLRSVAEIPDENAEVTRLVICQPCESAGGETLETAESAAEVIVEEEKSVDDMLLMFWHGVAAVIIGEMLALIAAVAWAIIKGNR